jgi:hypothetical protein
MEMKGKNFTRYYVETAISKDEARKFRNKRVRVKQLLDDVINTTRHHVAKKNTMQPKRVVQ